MGTALEVKETTFSELWELEPSREGKYTENDVIDAYLKGKKTGLESIQKTLVKALDENIDKCGTYTENVLKRLTEFDIKAQDAFLRINNFDFFNILVCIPEKDFLDDKFFHVYDFITEFEDSKNTPENNLTVEFSFLDFNSDFDYCVNKINSDGYILRLKK